MQVTVELPDVIAQQMELVEGDLPRRMLEALAVEGYRADQLSRGQISELLSLNFWETEGFLKRHGADLHYSTEDLDQDARSNLRVIGE